MDNVILDVVLGLGLIYAVLALLTTKVQEVWFGQMRSGRVRNLHKMLDEAVGHDSALKDKILANPMIFALWEGVDAAKKPKFWSAEGPSAIPPDLFARALLVALYDDPQGAHPSKVYTPEAFIRNKAPPEGAAAGTANSVWRTLRALLPGHEADWPGFEQAIADWFKAVGERADGWYQRYAQNRSLLVAVAVVGLVNADTFSIADRLANDPDLRRSLATIAQNVVRQREEASASAGTSKPTAPAASALSPEDRTESSLEKAAALIHSTYGRDDVAKFDPNFAAMGVELPPTDSKTNSKPNQKASKASSTPVPGALVEECAKASTDTRLIAETSRASDKSRVFLSNPINWLYVIPTLQTEVRILRRPARLKNGLLDDSARENIGLANIHDCVARLSGLVALAANQTTGATSRESLNEAVKQLDQAAAAIREWMQGNAVTLSLRRLFQADPDAFSRCSEDAATTRDTLQQCVLAAQLGRVNLPLGWGEVHRRLTLCRVVVEPLRARPPDTATSTAGVVASTEDKSGKPKKSVPEKRDTQPTAASGASTGSDSSADAMASAAPASAAASVASGVDAAVLTQLKLVVRQEMEREKAQRWKGLDASGWADGLCGEPRQFDGNAALRLPRMQLVGPDFPRVAFWVIGLLLTALLVALGAPFWFDVLGRVVKLRAAGSKAQDDALAPPKDPAGGKGASAGTGGAGGDGDEPFSLARNVLERVLTAGDVLALQAVLGAPRTGALDKATRAAIETRSRQLGLPPSDEVTLVLFQQLVGRMPEGLGSMSEPAASMRLDVEDARVPRLATALMTVTDFAGRIAVPPASVTNDVRALAVLWRYKRELEKNANVPDLDVAHDANTRHKLDEIPAGDVLALLDEKVPPKVYPRSESARWMDWAMGELGQAEAMSPAASTRAGSNRRILEYFETCGDTVSAESVAWCAAFVSWVLQQHHTVDLKQAKTIGHKDAVFFGGAGSTFGTRIWSSTIDAWPPAQAKFGDVVTTVRQNGNVAEHHVGFLISVDGDSIWLLSGNYSNRVGIDRIEKGVMVEIRRP